MKKGDVVVLKSGSPTMTVTDIGDYRGQKDMVFCTWFDGNNKKSDVFDMAVLDLCEYD